MLKLTRTHSILATAVALASLLPAAAHAQKPALTQNIDEKGRTPYYDTVIGSCTYGSCVLTFATVPAGYRLVVTHASIRFLQYSSAGGSWAFFANGGYGPSGYYYEVYLPAPATNGGNVYTYSSPITAYAEAGQQPSLSVFDSQADPVGTIDGYLVALNQ
jgi:hypothetical protein